MISPNARGWTVIRPTSTFGRKSLNGPSLTNSVLTFDKIRLFLELTSLNVAMMTNALADVIEAYTTTGNKDNLDWFVKMFTEDTTKEGRRTTPHLNKKSVKTSNPS